MENSRSGRGRAVVIGISAALVAALTRALLYRFVGTGHSIPHFLSGRDRGRALGRDKDRDDCRSWFSRARANLDDAGWLGAARSRLAG